MGSEDLHVFLCPPSLTSNLSVAYCVEIVRPDDSTGLEVGEVAMKRSTDRILTTHTGSLPRPPELAEMLVALDAGQLTDTAALAARTTAAVKEAVEKQRQAGLDVINDGEMGKVGYSTYVKHRLTGFGGESGQVIRGEAKDFPEWNERGRGTAPAMRRPACDGPIEWKDFAAVERDIADLKAALHDAGPVEEAFMTAASPGVVAHFLANSYFPSRDAYLEALANVMRAEYEAIANAGFILQLDCPELAMSRHNRYVDMSTPDFVKLVKQNVEVLNEATRNIAPEQMRLHLCWGNYEGPHHLDVELKDIIGAVLEARPAGLSFEGANPRHEHEWVVWQDVKLPDGKVIIPGVIDSTTNFIEHPELVAQRIEHYAGAAGKENVIAGTDCGFGTFATTNTVDTRVAWAKLKALAEGAGIASSRLW
jgi:5-methyltetrahydropteroyltriglutamate--homocysteine methyltransferase